MIISLIGFMGVGKSSVGRMLSLKLHYEFVDTDEIIVKRSGLTISNIFNTYGEKHFRILEEKALSSILDKDKTIVSTGGGIVLSAKNRKILREYTCPILLEASPLEIYKRVRVKNRPLLAEADDPRQVIKELLSIRRKYYHEFMNRVNTDGKTIEEIADEIIKITGAENYDEKN